MVKRRRKPGSLGKQRKAKERNEKGRGGKVFASVKKNPEHGHD